MGFYDFHVRAIDGREVSLSDCAGKVVVVVNTASKCGFTPQYEGLESLYRQYKAQGLEILGFPSNDFAGQEPGSNQDVATFCSRNYGVSFPLFEKTPVRGPDAHPLFRFLCEEQPFQGFDPEHPVAAILEKTLKENFPEFLVGNSVKWNFTKFLVDRKGQVVARYEPTSEPRALEDRIVELLKV